MCTLDPKLCQNEAVKRNVSESRILAEHVYFTPKPVFGQNIIANCVSESRILAEHVYITPKSVSERNTIARCVSEKRILANV